MCSIGTVLWPQPHVSTISQDNAKFGYRYYTVMTSSKASIRLQLRGLYSATLLQPGDLAFTAECRTVDLRYTNPELPHSAIAPSLPCECGFYVFTDKQTAMLQIGQAWVLMKVRYHGAIVYHNQGIRVQHIQLMGVYPLTSMLHEYLRDHEKCCNTIDITTKELADTFKLPILKH